MTTFRRLIPALAQRRLDTHLAVMFGMTAVLALLAIMLYVNSQVVAILDDASETLFSHIANESRSHVDKSVSNVDMLATLFASDPEATQFDQASQPGFAQRLRVVLDSTPVVSAIYFGYDDGSFVLLRRLSSEIARHTLNAPDDARYLLETIGPDASGHASLAFADRALKTIGTANTAATSFDPRTRDWYTQARRTDGSILTDPYRFFVTGERGVTLARALSAGHGVVGIDLGLADLSQDLAHMKSTPSMALLIVNARGAVIAASDPGVESIRTQSDVAGSSNASGSTASSTAPTSKAPAIEPAKPTATPSSATPPINGNSPLAALPAIVPAMLDASEASADRRPLSHVSVDGRKWSMRVAPIQVGPWTFRMAIAAPDDEMLQGARHLVTTLGWICVVLVIAVMLGIRATARAVSRPLEAIAQEAAAIQSFYFDDTQRGVRSSVVEIATLSDAIRKARLTIQRFIEIGRALSAESDPDRLMDRLLRETITITGAQDGLILLTEDQGATFSAVTRRDGVAAGDLLLSNADALGKRVTDALLDKAPCHFDASEPGTHPLLRSLVGDTPLRPGEVFRFSVLPLRNRAGEAIGGMVLLTRAHANEPASDGHLVLAHALSGNAAVAIETTLLLKSRKALLDSVIRMVAESIDAKSPYTSGHCQRVPMITLALARAACEAHTGPYARYALTPDEWEAVEVACWLHDCGKLTTAEYVIDKATKLETMTDRIHEIRMRFEVLKQQAHIDYWKGLASGADIGMLRATRDAELDALDADYAFVASCNEGGEWMAPERIARLERIAARTWMRTLDDRIGISTAEKMRKQRVPAAPLPAAERLLDDRPDHIVDHFPNHLSELEDKAGFTLVRPQHRLNLGEIYNLSIGRGTLTAEERFEINRHITRTIVMLEQLPLSGVLRRVPEYAGGHHEKMDGTGYPRGLRRDQMSPIARMMAIADVFEALTAGDRPYKKAKPLSEAIRIMGKMKEERHLDPDLLDLFLESGVWRDYARRFLHPDQIDEPDIAAVLAIRIEVEETGLFTATPA